MSGGAVRADPAVPAPRALVASGDAATVVRVQGALRSWGFAPVVAADVDEARERLVDASAPLALAVIDARLGTDLSALVRATPHLEAIPVVQFGDRVTFEREDGRVQTFRIVGEDQADPAKGSISYVAPIARALRASARSSW